MGSYEAGVQAVSKETRTVVRLSVIKESCPQFACHWNVLLDWVISASL